MTNIMDCPGGFRPLTRVERDAIIGGFGCVISESTKAEDDIERLKEITSDVQFGKICIDEGKRRDVNSSSFDSLREANKICDKATDEASCLDASLEIDKIDPVLTCFWTSLAQRLEKRNGDTYLSINEPASSLSCKASPRMEPFHGIKLV